VIVAGRGLCVYDAPMASARASIVSALLVLAGPLLAGAAGCRPTEGGDGAASASAISSTTTTTADAGAAPTTKAAKRRKPRPPKPPEHLNPGPEALGRKARSESRLKSEGVMTNGELPVIDSAAEAKMRSREAVVDRALALAIVALKSGGLEQAKVLEKRDELGAALLLSPDEKDFIDEANPTDKDRAQLARRHEGLAVMLWALGFETELPRPARIEDPARIVAFVTQKGAQKLREEARLRSAKELLDATDLIYRYDWACVAARMTSEPAPKGVDCEVVVERHRALNWLIGYQRQSWDDVSTDT
jgi:hypothetical protein